MLDSDLARLYGCKNGTKSLNLAVKRHINRFPERYMFQLNEEESKSFWFQIETKKSIEKRGGKYNKSYVFTEQGVAMLATILKTEIAEEMSIMIMDAFVAMRKYISTNLIEQKYFNELTIKNTEDIKLLKESFDKLSTKEEVIIIDNYAGRELFNIIKDIKVKVKVYTKNIDNIAKTKYEEQYSNLEIINIDIFHDRFILIDKKILYHSGASFKDIGKKCFGINKIEDTNVIKDLISRLEVIK